MKSLPIRFACLLGLSLTIAHAASDVSITTVVSSGGAFSGGNPNVFTPTASQAVVNTATIQTSLNAGAGQILLQNGSLESTTARTVPASSVQVSNGAAWKQWGTLTGNRSVAASLSAGPSADSRTPAMASSLSSSDWSSIRGAYDAGRHVVELQRDGSHVARNPGQKWRAEFDGRGFLVQPDHARWTWGLELKLSSPAPPAAIYTDSNKITYRWNDNLSEWFINDSRGLEQGWTIRTKPPGHETLVLDFTISGGLTPRVSSEGTSVTFEDQGAAALTYGGLKAWDAKGKNLDVSFTSRDSHSISVTVNDSLAEYPVTIDPVAQQAYLKASNAGPSDFFGEAVAISGNTVVVGAPLEDSNATGFNGDQSNNSASGAGAAYVFVKNGNAWTQQGYLKASNTAANAYFGKSVAITGDTVVIGSPGQGTGAAYVFVRSGITWSEQAFLKASPYTFSFGGSVALSGETLIVGAESENSNATGVNGNQNNSLATNSGAAYVFVRSGTTWSQQAYLKASNTASGDQFGGSVAISGDTAVVGAVQESSTGRGVNSPQTNRTRTHSGAAYVFFRTGTTWAQQAYLKSSNSDAFDHFGSSLAISGNTIVAGAPWEWSAATGVNGSQADNTLALSGAAYVFFRTGSTWTQQAYVKASNTGENDEFGKSVGISGDTLVVGASGEAGGAPGIDGNQSDNTKPGSGAVYTFSRSGTTWNQQNYIKSSYPSHSLFGYSIAVDTTGVIVGAVEEHGTSSGINGDPTVLDTTSSGAAYPFDLAAPVADIAVEQPISSDIGDGGTRNLGSVVTGNFVETTFTIRNTGGEELKGVALTINGPNAAEFTVPTPPSSRVVGYGATTSFVVRFTPTSGGLKTAQIQIASNDPDESPFDITVTGTGIGPEIGIEDDTGSGVADGGSVDLGAIPFTTTRDVTFTIRNTGVGSLTGLGITTDGPNSGNFAIITLPSSPVSGPTGFTTMVVRFAPGSPGVKTATLHLQNNDSDENPFAINLTGTGIGPEIAVEQPAGTDIPDGGSKDFGPIGLGSNKPLTFTIRNTAAGNLTGLGITKDGANAAEFSVTANPVAPVTGPGGTTTFTVTFAPSSAGIKTAALHIANNDTNENPFDITLTGTCFAPEIAVEQPAGTNVADGGSKTFGSAALGEFVDQTFTIRNTGSADLTGLTITKDGTGAADFIIISPPSAPVGGPTGTTTFTVRFMPTVSGTRTAAIHIACNDADENPFDINLTGAATVGTLNVDGDSKNATAPIAGGMALYQVTIPAGYPGMRLVLNTTGSGDADLYIQRGTSVTTSSYLKRSVSSTGRDTIYLTEAESTAGTYTIGIHRPTGQTGDLSYTLTYERGWLHDVTWDNGSGTNLFTLSDPITSDYYFRVTVPAGTSLGAFAFTTSPDGTGSAPIYVKSTTVPTPVSFTASSVLPGSNGVVLNESQFATGEVWYAMVRYDRGAGSGPASFSLRAGDPVVRDLGTLPATEGANSGDLVMGPEGIAFFKTIIPAGTSAWALWTRTNTGEGAPLTNLATNLRVRKLMVPTNATYTDKASGNGQLLLVPPYINSSSDTYFISVATAAGTRINLASYQQPVVPLSFDSETLPAATTANDFYYKTYRVNVPVQQIAWDVAVTPSAGDANVCVRRDNTPAEFDNDAFSEVTGTTSDSITLVPDFLTDATWFITVYGNSPYTFTLKNGPPTITPLSFTDTKLNDQTTRAGWRFYTMTDVPSQLGSLGWELNLANQVPGTEIAIRRNAVPSRWRSRVDGSTSIGTLSRVDASGAGGFLQRPAHQADIWYVGIYTPTQALGAFTLTCAPMVPTLQTFNGGVQTFSNQEPGRFKYVRIDVPAGVLGWDVRLTNVTGPIPQMVVRRDQLPQNAVTTDQYNGYWIYSNALQPSESATWPSGHQWAGGGGALADWTNWTYDIGAPINSQALPRLLMGMGRPLEPGTYYVGVYNNSTTTATSYTIDSRGIGAGQTYAIADLAYAGGSTTLSNLARREANYFKVNIPVNTPSWEVTLSPTTGEMLLLVRRGTVPDFNGISNGDVVGAGAQQIEMQKAGPERYVMLPQSGQNYLPVGDYYLAVVGEGVNPATTVIGSGASSGTLTSQGPLNVSNLGTANAAGSTTPVALAGGQLRAYQFTVPVGTASLEVRLDNRVGNPMMSMQSGTGLPVAYTISQYGNDGGTQASDWIYNANILTVANPTPGIYSLLVGAGAVSSSYPDASANLAVIANAPIPLAFDAGISVITNQSAGSWRYLQVTVPAGVLGWDLRLTGVSGATPRMFVRRDQLPANLNLGDIIQNWNGSYYTAHPYASDTWPSGYQWLAPYAGSSNMDDYDWTGKAYNPGSPATIAPPRLVMGMGRPLEPGTYFVGIYNNAAAPISYTVDSRGIGTGQTYQPVDLAFSGGTASITNLAPREAKYFKLNIPVNTPSWQVKLAPSSGEMALKIRRSFVPDFGNRELDGASSPTGDLEIMMRKAGPEHYIMMPAQNEDYILAGDYYLAVISEGVNAPDAVTVGTGTSSGTLTSVGPLTIANLGAASAAGITQAVSLEGGQNKAFQFTVPVGTASLEVRLDNRVGNPGLSLNPGSRLPYANGYGVEGGTQAPGWAYGDIILTIANPTPGIFTLLVRAQYLNGLYPDASANLVIVANAPIPLGFDSATSTVTNQSPGAWRHFQITVPAGVMGWDVRLTNVTGDSNNNMQPIIVVRRDQLPASTDTTLYWPGQTSQYDSPSRASAWPSGFQWTATHFRQGYGLPQFDWTALDYEFGTYTMPPSRLVMGMGRPLEPGTYYVGVYNSSTTTPTSYSIDSRGIGTGQTYPVAALPYNGGIATINNLAPREARYFKVTIPANTPSWEVTLAPSAGEMMLKLRQGTVPDLVRNDNYGGALGSENLQIEMQKAGPERYVMLPPPDADTIPAGDYYLAVISEGVNPNISTDQIGTGTSSGTLTSVGPLAITNLGTASAAGTTQAVSLAGGQNKAFQFTVPVGTASLEVRLDNRVGNPGLNLNPGSRLPSANGYGVEGGTQAPGWDYDDNILTIANPTPGIFTLLVRAQYLNGLYPDASANLIVSTKPNIPLNFAASLNGGNGGTDTDTRQMVDGEYTIYQIEVPAMLDGQSVNGWILDSDVLQGAVSLNVYKNLADPTSGFSIDSGYAVVVPPYLTRGDTWYVRVKATGLTNYTITSRPVTTERSVWQMPVASNQTFGDSGNDTNGNPLPGDRGIDLAQEEWHFYAVDVPEGNLGLMRTELQAISGNPDLYIREDGVPTTSHDSNGPAGIFGYPFFNRQLTDATTEYGNWVPLDGKTENQLAPGRWYLGVKAAGNSNVRYRLSVSTGQVTDLPLNGGNATNQTLADNDWRYYRFTVPADAPVNWELTFSQQVGDVVMWLRDSVPPGQNTLNNDVNIASWYSDGKNQGPYENAGHDTAGTYTFSTPPLRPGHTYYAGFRSNSSATFSVSSATSGGTIGTLPVLDFYTGTLNTSVPANSSVLYRILAPVEATRMKWTSTHASTVQLRLEQGSIPISTGSTQHYYSSTANSVFNNPLSATNWPWQADQSYYLRIVNTAATAATVSLIMNGKIAATDDEDADGLPDAWENAHYGAGYAYNSYGPNDDPDGDDSTNLQEYQNGTEPKDSASAKYTLTVNASGGTVGRNPPQTLYDKGTSVTLTATPTAPLVFGSWSGAATGSTNPLVMTMDANKVITAVFVADTFTDFLVNAGVPVGDRGETADPDKDGIVNLLEYILGGNPTLPSSGLLPEATKAPGSNNLVFTYKRKLDATGVTQIIEHATNLSPPWTPAVHGTDGVTIITAAVPGDATAEQVTVTIPSTSTSRFVRLKVSR